MAFSLPQVPFKLTPQDMGATDLTDALTKGINLGFLPQEKQANLQSTLLKNIYQKIVNQYAPEDYQTTFDSRRAQTKLTNEQADWWGPNTQSEINLRGSQGRLADQEARFEPLKAYTNAANALRLNSRSEKASDFIRAFNALPADQKKLYIAQHPSEYMQYMSDLASGNTSVNNGTAVNQNPLERILEEEIRRQGGYNFAPTPMNSNQFQAPRQAPGSPPIATQQQVPNTLTGVIQSALSGQSGNVPQNTTQQSQQQVGNQNVGNAVINTLPVEDRPDSNDPDIRKAQDTLNQAKFKSTQDQDQQMKDAALLSVVNKSNPAAMNNRTAGAKVFEKFLQEMRTPENIQRFLNVAKQAGRISQAERKVQEWLPESMQSQSYKDWKWYTDTFQKAVTSTVKQMEKLNGDKKQIQMLQELTGILYDPDLGEKSALKNFNESIRTLQKMSNAIIDASEPSYAKGINKRMYNLPGEYDNYVYKDATKMATIIDPAGGEHEVPEDKVEEAIKLHPGTKRKE